MGRIYFPGNDGSQNMLIYQPPLDTLELKSNKGTGYGVSWKSKGVYNSKLKRLYIILSNDLLDVEQNNYLTEL